MTQITYSYSSLRAFANCPRNFKARYIDKTVKFQPSPAMERGSRVHESLEAAVKSGAPTEVWTPPGLLPLLHQAKAKAEVRLAVENDTQAVARDVVMWQALLLPQHYKIVLLVHDEIVLCVPEAQAEQAQADLLRVLCTAPPWAQGLPLQGEVFIVDQYGDAG